MICSGSTCKLWTPRILPNLNQGELAVLYCFVFLYFSFAGAGTYSIDAMRNKSE